MGRFGVAPHSDYGMITLLTQDPIGGLELRKRDGEWVRAPWVEGTFVVNLGDMFQRWTNDLYVSTLHRVTNSSGKARISVPLFNYPHGDTVIECLPTCASPEQPPRHAPVVAEAYNRELADRAARTGRPGVSAVTAARLTT